MKRTILILGILTISSMMIIGCGGAIKETKGTKVQEKGLVKEFDKAPGWVLNPSVEKDLAAVGSAKVGKVGMQFARTEALANGRDELARIMSVKVSNMVKNFAQVTGLGDSQAADKVSSQVSKQVASEVLSGSRQKDMWISPSGDVYILVVVDTSLIKQVVKDSVQSSYKNDEALSQQWQAKNAQDELNKEVDKEFGGVKEQK
ncbi:LPP20 family lipoprotein [bacterium]|nr:LPP20 family lipoprotein [bacterium]